MNFSKGICNLFKVSTVNILILLCLTLILLIIYLNTNTVELFIIDNNDYLTSFVNQYIRKMNIDNDYKKKLESQDKRIKELSASVINILNPST